jgi:Retroviral aspartyl protease
LSLCFKCGVKYHQGHKYKIQGLHVLDGDELSEIDSDTDELATYSTPPCEPKSDMVTITLCASQSMSNHRTIKLQGQIRNIPLMIMLVSGSTHSFLNPTIVHNLSLLTIECSVLQVSTISGTVLTTSTMCANPAFTIFSPCIRL